MRYVLWVYRGSAASGLRCFRAPVDYDGMDVDVLALPMVELRMGSDHQGGAASAGSGSALYLSLSLDYWCQSMNDGSDSVQFVCSVK